MRKHVKRVITCMVIVTVIFTSIVSAHALVAGTQRDSKLSFNGTTVQCYAYVIDPGKTITVTAKLWRGTMLIGTWSDTGNSFVDVNGIKLAQSGQTYTLRVSYTINGVTHDLPDITKTCPNNTE